MAAGDEASTGPGDDSATVVSAALRWLALQRDVVIRGTDGSGRTRVLESLLREFSRRSMTSVLIRGAGALPFAALRAQPSVIAERVPATAPALGAWLAGELQGRRALLLLDDLDQFDEASSEILLQAVRTSGAAVVATSSLDLAGHARGAVADLVAERAPAELRLPPLGFEAMSRLLAGALRGPVDVALTSSITARSGGNPRVALALAAAGRFAGVLQLVDGRWRKVGSLDEAPADPVAHALLARLDPEHVAALELLAWTGPLPRAQAEQVLDPVVLDVLAELGRLRQVPTGPADTLSVDPPALAAAVRARLSHDRRRRLAARVDAQLGAVRAPFYEAGTDVAGLLGDRSEVYWQWAADLTGLVHEHATAGEAAHRALWQTQPTVAHANAYLGMLLRRRTDGQVAAVFADTERAESDTVDDLMTFRLYELRWDAWRGVLPDPDLSRVEMPGVVVDAVRRLLLTRQAELSDLAAGPVEVSGSRVLRQWQVVMRTARLLELGHAELAIDVCNLEDPTRTPDELDHLLEGLHGEALILLGRREQAEQRSEALLERAFRELDLLGIRVHACLLAEAMVLRSDLDAAWRVLSMSLRLGPGGPLDNTFFRRSLAIGAVVEAQRGAGDVAQMLLDELDGTPHSFQPLIHSLGALGRAALADARGESATGDLLWQAGERYLARGLAQPALACWLAHPRALDPERLSRVRATYAACPVPLLEPYLRLHEALAVGDQDGIVAALGTATVDVAGLIRTAVASLDAEHVGHQAVCALDPRARPAADDAHREALSAREREIAALAGAGSTNRQIADALGLSVRTVENHVSSALRKLGVTSRAELLRWFPPSERART